MAVASYPESVPVFETLQDDVHWELADHQNNPNEEIAAISTFLGFLGVPQSKATSLVPQLYELLPTIKISFVNTTTVQASAGVVWCKNAGSTIHTPRKNIATVNITGADLDAGGPGLGNDATYFIYADADATASTAAFSLSTNAATPGDSSVFRLTGGFGTDGSGNVIEETVWSMAGARLVDVKFEDVIANDSTTDLIPKDNTLPLFDEGKLWVDMVKTPAKPTNLIEVTLIAYIGTAAAGSTVAISLFKDASGADASIAAAAQGIQGGNLLACITLTFHILSGATAQMIFSSNFGAESGTAFLNSGNATRHYGGALKSKMIIREYEVGP